VTEVPVAVELDGMEVRVTPLAGGVNDFDPVVKFQIIFFARFSPVRVRTSVFITAVYVVFGSSSVESMNFAESVL
jgi:hypothetical protein